MISPAIVALSMTLAAPDLAVSVHTPSLYFATLEEKAAFVTKLEEALSASLDGASVKAIPFTATPKLGQTPLWLVDGTTAAVRPGLTVIRQARYQGVASSPTAVYVTKAWKPLIELFRKGTFAQAVSASELSALVRYWLLLDEPGAAAIAARGRGSRDARASLVAVAAGELDGCIAYRRDYGKLSADLAAVKEQTPLGELPLPVLAIDAAALPKGVTLDALKATLAKVTLPTVAGMVDGWGAPDVVALSALSRALLSKTSPESREYWVAELPPPVVNLSPLLPEPPAPMPLLPDIFVPERAPQALPDPPDAPDEPNKALLSATGSS